MITLKQGSPRSAANQPARSDLFHAGIAFTFQGRDNPGALLVVDASLSACDGSLLICAIDGEFRIKRYRTHPQPHLINLENGRKEALPEDGDGYNSSHAIFGVITYIINDARNAEFDDCPVM